MAATQDNRPVRFKSPLGDDVLLLASLNGTESLSQPFSYELSLLSEKGDIEPDDLLGRAVTIELDLPENRQRVISGVVTDLAQVGFMSRYHQYQATIRPWFWFLTRTADCRIFQNKTIPEIFEQVVKAHRFSDYELKLKGKYPKWEYCVQYRETDFNFLARLLEQEGIYYFFKHENGSHKMVLVDDPSAHQTIEGYDTVPYYPPSAAAAQRVRDHLTSWSFSKSVQTGAYATTDFDFEQPRKALLGKATGRERYEQAKFEIFDYPAELQNAEKTETDRIAKIRLDELQATQLLARGHGDAGGLATGARFKLDKYEPRKQLNIEYLIVSSTLNVSVDGYQTAEASPGAAELSVSVEAIDAKTVYRPPRITAKPVIQGAQTAMVVGKAGEEIWTDKFARVKVQFPWDRHGRSDENSSCWVRVAQVWAGSKWGGIQIPRIGQEVIVSFLEGDPDQPIITGRVYNGAAMPPYDLPTNQTQSGLKSSSSKGGGGSNELRFEDKAGSEDVYLHAQKDFHTVVENDDDTKIIRHETADVGKNRTRKVGENETVEIGKNSDRKTGQNETIDVGKKYLLKAGDEITLQTGAAKLVMKKNGDITIEGLKVVVKGSTKVQVESGVQVQVKGTQVSVKGTMLELSGDAMAKLKGGVTMIG